MRTILVTALLISLYEITFGQTDTHALIDNINRNIDRAVVQRNFDKLKASYSDDFVFTHGTGVVDSKESWLTNIQKSQDKFVSREHDSTRVELHGDVAILTGRLLVVKEKGSRYGLKYIRVYCLRNGEWLLISHRTIQEWHY